MFEKASAFSKSVMGNVYARGPKAELDKLDPLSPQAQPFSAPSQDDLERWHQTVADALEGMPDEIVSDVPGLEELRDEIYGYLR